MSSLFCPDCCIAYLRHHPNLHGWKKCEYCSFSRLEIEMITIDDYLMGRSEKYKSEYSEEIKQNALILINKVNQLLKDLGIDKVTVSSGWRPPSLNATIKGAAAKSAHTVGMAVDLHDKDYELYNKIAARPDLLKKYDLWLEDKEKTKSWCHLDFKTRADRPSRIFKA